MAWSAILREAKRSAGQWDVSIIYTDGLATRVRGYTVQALSDGLIQQLAREEIARLTASDAGSTTLAGGSAIDVTPPADAPPVVDAARDAFFRDVRTYRRYLRMIELGVLAATDTRVTTLKAAIVAAFQPSYQDGI